MNVVDSSAWLSFLAGDQNSRTFAVPIADLAELLVPTIIITEVFKNILRQRGEEAALRVLAHMEQRTVIPLSQKLAIDAANFGVEFKLPFAGSMNSGLTPDWTMIVGIDKTDLSSATLRAPGEQTRDPL